MSQRRINFFKQKLGKMDIIILPFCKNSPLFLHKNFFEELQFVKQTNATCIMCFYTKTPLRHEQNAMVVRFGKVESIFGESFSNKFGLLNFKNFKIKILLQNTLFSSSQNGTDADIILGFDDEEMQNEEFMLKKFDGKLLFINPTPFKTYAKLHTHAGQLKVEFLNK